jgi:hypothetical protein
MKKKRLLFIGLSLALLLVLLVPSAALAKNNKAWQSPVYTDFKGGGDIYVSAMPAPLVQGNIWSFNDEIVEGWLDSDWELLANSAFWCSHDSCIKVDGDGTTFGWMWGNFKITSLVYPDSVMQGTFFGKITGNMTYLNISDTGTWTQTWGTGVFAGANAYGSWSAQLAYSDYYKTLVGSLDWQGKYTSSSLKYDLPRPGKVSYQWSPVKPWKPFTPAVYSWFRR